MRTDVELDIYRSLSNVLSYLLKNLKMKKNYLFEYMKSPECGTSWHETSMDEGLCHKVSVKSKFITKLLVLY